MIRMPVVRNLLLKCRLFCRGFLIPLLLAVFSASCLSIDRLGMDSCDPNNLEYNEAVCQHLDVSSDTMSDGAIEDDVDVTDVGDLPISGAQLVSLNGSAIIFPSIVVQQSSPQMSIYVKNIGNRPATQIQKEITEAVFQEIEGTYPDTLSPGDEAIISSIKFAPTVAVDYNGILRIRYHNGSDLDVLNIELFGPGIGFYGHIGWGQERYFKRADMFIPIDSPVFVTQDPNGNLFVSDQGVQAVHKISASGAYIGLIGHGDNHFRIEPRVGIAKTGDRYFFNPWGIATDTYGNLFIVDAMNHRVQKWAGCSGPDSSCTYQGWIGKGHSNGFASEEVGGSSLQGNGNGEFNVPQGITIDSFGNLFIADTANNRIQKWNGCAMQSDSCQYAGWIGRGHLTGFSPSGIAAHGSNGGEFNRPIDVAFDSSGHLFITDSYNHRVQKWKNCAGQSICTYFGWIGCGRGDNFESGICNSSGTSDHYFTKPTGISVRNQSGKVTIFVSDAEARIQKWHDCTPDGNTCSYIGWIGKGHTSFTRGTSVGTGEKDGELNYPEGVFVSSNGALYVADLNNRRVVHYQKCLTDTPSGCDYLGWQGGFDGAFQNGTAPVYKKPEDRFFYEPYGIALDSQGNLYIADTFNHRIQKWANCTGTSPLCEYVGWIGNGDEDPWQTGKASSGTGARYFDIPTGIIFDSLGNLYIGDSGNHRIQKWSDCATGACEYKGWIGKGHTNEFNSLSSGGYGSLGGEFYSPRGLAIDSAGNLFIADTQNHRVQKWRDCVTGSGCHFQGWIGGGIGVGFHNGSVVKGSADAYFDGPTFLVVDSSGHLYISDSNNNRVQKWLNCAGDGTCSYLGWLGKGENGFITGISQSGENDAYFYYPLGLKFDSEGNLIIADNANIRIQKWADCSGSGSCRYVGWIGDGDMAWHTGKEDAAVQAYYLADGYFGTLAGLDIDSNGYIYVSDYIISRVSRIRP